MAPGWRVLPRDEIRPGGDPEAVARRGAKHEPPQPVGQVDAENQQVTIAQLREQPFWRGDIAAHQPVDELERILVVDREVGLARGATEEVEHDGRLPPAGP